MLYRGCEGEGAMKRGLNSLVTAAHEMPPDWRPRIFRTRDKRDELAFRELLAANPELTIHDTIPQQLAELLRTRTPDKNFPNETWVGLVHEHVGRASLDTYGVWVHYPWLHAVIHLLDEEEFTELRTSRNRYKITME